MPAVRVGQQAPLNGARVAFATYVVAMHNRIHPTFTDDFLSSLPSLPKGDPLAGLTTRLEIVLDKETGRITRMGVIKTSGSTSFDVGALPLSIARRRLARRRTPSRRGMPRCTSTGSSTATPWTRAPRATRPRICWRTRPDGGAHHERWRGLRQSRRDCSPRKLPFGSCTRRRVSAMLDVCQSLHLAAPWLQ
jgi:hypothetical protein